MVAGRGEGRPQREIVFFLGRQMVASVNWGSCFVGVLPYHLESRLGPLIFGKSQIAQSRSQLHMLRPKVGTV